jgi:hypothetical protein
MRYSRDKETIEESTSVNAGCRDVMTVQRLVERGETEFALNIQHPLLMPPPEGVETQSACYALQEIEMV